MIPTEAFGLILLPILPGVLATVDGRNPRLAPVWFIPNIHIWLYSSQSVQHLVHPQYYLGVFTTKVKLSGSQFQP